MKNFNNKSKISMKKMITLLTIVIVLSTSFTSCGVMFGGSRYQGTVTVKDHPNADIYVDGQKIGTGETTALFPRNRPLMVKVSQEGCEDSTQTFHKSFRTGNFILSVISWGVIGAGVDLGTGASYQPDFKGNQAIHKMSTKDFRFDVDYSKCKNPITK